MKFLICLLGILISSCAFAKTEILKFNPNNSGYTNIVQDVAVFQESCQNHFSGHYYSKLYDFNFHHDANGNCIINYGNALATFNVVLDDDARYVVRNMHAAIVGASIIYDISMKKRGKDNYYLGTITMQRQ